MGMQDIVRGRKPTVLLSVSTWCAYHAVFTFRSYFKPLIREGIIMTQFAYTILNDDENEVSNLITDYCSQERFTEDMWKTTVKLAAGCIDEDGWVAHYEAGEARNVERRTAAGETFKYTKAGKLVASRAFPKSWNDAKAVVSKALRYNKPLLDDEGNPLSKADVMASYKEDSAEETNAKRNNKPAIEKIQTVIHAYATLYGELSDDEQATVRGLIDAIHLG